MRLKGSVCLVTGATSGIGRATALVLAEAGGTLIVCGRDESALADVAAATAGEPLACDLSGPGAPVRLAEEALALRGRVDVLVNAAGVGLSGNLVSAEAEAIERLLAVNVTAPIELTCALLPGMLERRQGHVVNIGSVVSHVGRGGEAVYAASKAALALFSESLRYELRGTGVSASLITPGVVDTPFFEHRGAPYDRSWPAPIGPHRVAEAVLAAIRRDRPEIVVPTWLGIASRIRGLSPALFRRLAARFG
ncbi:MAG: SDR family NAD(P)-dependent oxidoreductase [Gaiellaceae bacterium]